MIINYFDLKRIAIVAHETDAELVIEPDAVLTSSVA
jgi:hypothetical protein